MLYLHIPFCKQACSYCNFHFSTSSKGRTELLAAMGKEIRLRAGEFNSHPLETIYLGGGTPSLLNEAELADLFAAIQDAALDFNSETVLTSSRTWRSGSSGRLQSSNVSDLRANVAKLPAFGTPKGTAKSNVLQGPHPSPVEITFEANPDDLTEEKVAMLAASLVNRLSIGLQSFDETDLRFMNRAHSANESTEAMQRVLKAGFTDISVDLIYGSPTTSDATWDDNISRVLDFGVPHVSAYALTVEPKTVLAHQVKTGKVTAPSDARFARQYDRLIERLTLAGYEHYEISNFALPGRYSKHNTAYWQGKPYVGIGPAAHGFNGIDQRRWNVANNAIYTRQLEQIESPKEFNPASGLFEIENLSLAERYNEFVMTGLRTKWGVSLADLETRFGEEFRAYFQANIASFVELYYFEVSALKKDQYVLTPAGRHHADGIAAEAFWVVE